MKMGIAPLSQAVKGSSERRLRREGRLCPLPTQVPGILLIHRKLQKTVQKPPVEIYGDTPFLDFIYSLCMRGAYVYRGGTTGGQGTNFRSQFLLLPCGSKDQTQITRPGSKGLYLLSQLTNRKNVCSHSIKKITITALLGCCIHSFCLMVSRLKPWAPHAGKHSATDSHPQPQD